MLTCQKQCSQEEYGTFLSAERKKVNLYSTSSRGKLQKRLSENVFILL